MKVRRKRGRVPDERSGSQKWREYQTSSGSQKGVVCRDEQRLLQILRLFLL